MICASEGWTRRARQDYNSLALDLLRSLVRDTMRYDEVMGREVSLEAGVRLKTKSFVEKCREYDINDLSTFYSSPLFAGSGFSFAENANFIVYVRKAQADAEAERDEPTGSRRFASDAPRGEREGLAVRSAHHLHGRKESTRVAWFGRDRPITPLVRTGFTELEPPDVKILGGP